MNAATAPEPKRPGPIQGEIEARFHTGEAVALVRGRQSGAGKSPIIGLTGFSRRAHQLMAGSRHRDPFADWGLLEIEVRLQETSDHMQAQGKTLTDLRQQRLDPGVRDSSRVAFETRHWSAEPVVEKMILGHYATSALYCLIQFDELVLLAKGLQHHRLLPPTQARKLMDEAGRKLRALFQLGSRYQYCGCTRDDLLRKTRVGLRAVETLTASGYIDRRMFFGVDDICQTYGSLEAVPEFLQAERSTDADEPTVEAGTD